MAKITGVQAGIIANLYKRALRKKGYLFFDANQVFNLNIIGVRANTNFTNLFDDAIVVIYRNLTGQWNVNTYEATTDPGKSMLMKPVSDHGTAILVPDQYRSAYKIDKHRNKYIALCQKGKVKVYRDNNKDTNYDMTTAEEGIFGINIHRAATARDTKYVNSWSAGCQVINNAKNFYEFMDLCKISADKFGNSFTYTLICEDDLNAN